MEASPEMLSLDERDLRELRTRAREHLRDHWNGQYIVPSEKLYPHQWSWDAAWLALGLSSFRPRWACRQLDSLFEHQWDNGMVPQIVFETWENGNYSPGPERWQSEVARAAPEEVRTSGIVQPPLHATAALRVCERRGREASASFRERIVPKLLEWHRFLYRERDPEDEGLVFVCHPWESGMDNSPAWDPPLKHVKIPEDLDPVSRNDLDHEVPEDHRPSDEKYRKFFWLVDLFRRCDYNQERIYRRSPFLVQPVLFNAVLCRANRDLASLLRMDQRDSSEPERWAKRTAEAMQERLWDPEEEKFYPYDLHNRRLIRKTSVGEFTPFFGEVLDSRQSGRLLERLDSVGYCPVEDHGEECWSVPTSNIYAEEFDGDNYWRGPVWAFTNWMLLEGLRNYHEITKARAIEDDLLQLVHSHGFSEYWDPLEGQPLGVKPFFPTAAIVLDVLERYLPPEPTH